MKTVLLIDDDERLTRVLARRFNATERFNAEVFLSVKAALDAAPMPVYAIFLDMMLEDEVGLDYVEALNDKYAPEHLIIMTGYASIATTVAAMKKGATDYIAKPVGFQELLARLGTEHEVEPVSSPELKPMTAAQVEWEHIQRVLAAHDGNISRTADALGMHRRSLQRKLQKYSPSKE